MDHNHSTSGRLPNLPVCGITFPSTPYIAAALEFTEQHTSPATVNHCMRSAAFALVCISKLPHLAHVDKDLVILSCIMHDLGWATTKSLISKDKRFEVDGADIARSWVREHSFDVGWDERQIQLSWDAIALHAMPSIARHKEPEVMVTNMGIFADFAGPNMPGGLITVDEYKEIIRAFPKLGLSDEVIDIMCGFCREKPETTYDNFVSGFGIEYGLDGKGTGKEEFAEKVKEHGSVPNMMAMLKTLDQYED